MNNTNKVIVVGYGSIGRRHARILSSLGCSVACVTGQKDCDFPIYTDLESAVGEHNPNIIIVANETIRHCQTILKLKEINFDGTLLVEKPLSDKLFDASHAPPNTYVAYNLRFHPTLLSLRSKVKNRETVLVSIIAGQHLTEWRPGRNIRHSYSASKDMGGGVLRDLSHELDYILWLFGEVSKVTALGGNRNVLGIDADEVWSIMLEMKSGAIVNLSLSYLNVPACRQIKILTSEDTIEADLINGNLTVNSKTEYFDVDRDFTYSAMHQAILNNETSNICSLTEGLKVVSLIECIELAEISREWQWL